jgi:uncharacterized protein (TIGR00290 family)
LLEKAVFSWSGGKDSALCLLEARKESIEIAGLLTTVTRDFDRISMHGVRTELLRRQAIALGLPLYITYIPRASTNAIYEEAMKTVLQSLRTVEGISTIAFGDLFLQDIRQYREKFLHALGMDCLFPLWGRDTRELASFFIESGFKAKICCVDPRKLEDKFCGREFDESFLSEIPREVDPCGENGEFHTFVYDAPIFKEPIKVKTGDIVQRDGFWFADLLPS